MLQGRMQSHGDFEPRRAVARAWAIVFAVAALGGCGTGADDARAAARETVPAAPRSGPDAVRRARLTENFVELNLGDVPYRFRAVLERNNGRVDTVAAALRAVDDSSVVALSDGAVQAREVGQASVRVDVEGQRLRAVVQVSERVFADSVWLAPGEVRAWDLRPGWHRITVDADAPPGEPQPLELAADLICVPDARAPKETIVCRVRQNTRVLLRHTGVGRRPGRALAVVTIRRTPR